MIGIQGQWVCKINEDEISSDELYELKIEDVAGLALPTLELNITTQDEAKVKELSTIGKEIKIGLGKEDVVEEMTFQVFKRNLSQGVSGADKYFTKIWAVLGQVAYLDKQRLATYNSSKDMKRSDEVWSTVMGRYGITSETLPFKDKMLWLQYNVIDRKFLDEVTWHGYYADNDPCLSAIRREMKGVYKPLSALRTKKGTIGDTDSVDYKSNYYETKQNEGFLSIWGGGQRINPMHRLEQGADDEARLKVSPQIIDSGLRQDAVKFTEYQFTGDNVHKYWWQAYEQNRILRASLMALQVEFHFDQYHSLYPLDYVGVQWSKADGNVVENISGEWLVVKNMIFLSGSTYQQKTMVTREQLL